MSAKSANARLAENLSEGGDGIDFSERAGFLVGKAAALADWSFRKEQQEFEAYCKRLQARNRARKERQEHPEQVRARCNAWRAANHERYRKMENARRADKRVMRMIVCDVCLTIVPSNGKFKRFCGQTCRNQWHGVPRARARCRGIRTMTIRHDVMEILRAGGPMTLAQVRAAGPQLKQGSVATMLCVLTKAGILVTRGSSGGRPPGKVSRTYELASAPELTLDAAAQ